MHSYSLGPLAVGHAKAFVVHTGPHCETARTMVRYHVIATCSCRTRLEKYTRSKQTMRVRTECSFCGDAVSVALNRAQPAHLDRRRISGERFVQRTRCVHSDCSAHFEFEYDAHGDELLNVVCTRCGTVKQMRRRRD